MISWLTACSATQAADGPEAVTDTLYDNFNLLCRSDTTKVCDLICVAPLQPIHCKNTAVALHARNP